MLTPTPRGLLPWRVPIPDYDLPRWALDSTRPAVPLALPPDGTNPECREWVGLRTGRLRYGAVRSGDCRWRCAHVLVAHLAFASVGQLGAIPLWTGDDRNGGGHGVVIDHLCRRPQCATPGHLRATTNRANALTGWLHRGEPTIGVFPHRPTLGRVDVRQLDLGFDVDDQPATGPAEVIFRGQHVGTARTVTEGQQLFDAVSMAYYPCDGSPNFWLFGAPPPTADQLAWGRAYVRRRFPTRDNQPAFDFGGDQ